MMTENTETNPQSGSEEPEIDMSAAGTPAEEENVIPPTSEELALSILKSIQDHIKEKLYSPAQMSSLMDDPFSFIVQQINEGDIEEISKIIQKGIMQGYFRSFTMKEVGGLKMDNKALANELLNKLLTKLDEEIEMKYEELDARTNANLIMTLIPFA